MDLCVEKFKITMVASFAELSMTIEENSNKERESLRKYQLEISKLNNIIKGTKSTVRGVKKHKRHA